MRAAGLGVDVIFFGGARPESLEDDELTKGLEGRQFMRPLRILMVEPVTGSGDWHYANMLSSALADEGVDVRLATLFPFEPVPSPRSVPIISMGPKPPVVAWPHLVSAQRALYHVAKMRALHRVILELQPDIVHFQRPLGILDFAYFRRIRGLGPRIVYTIHTPLPPQIGRVARARLRQVDLILTHALRTKKQLMESGLPELKIKKILHGNYLHLCRPSDLSPGEARRLLGLPADARVILFFGTIEWRKGLDRLIEAFAILARRDQGLYLLIAGYPNEDFGPYERRMFSLGVRERVVVNLRWIAYSEMQEYFNAASIVALPYRRISQSGIIQLAYAYARPVVVTDVGGIGEVVSEDGTGVIAKSEDVAGIAEAIQVLLSDPERAARMGQRGRDLAGTKYAWPGVARQVVGFYRMVHAVNGDRPA